MWMYVAIFLFVVIAVLSFFLLNAIQRKERMKGLMQREKAEAQRMRESMEEQERYLAYTSHELRTPLNAIAGGTQLLAKTNLDAKQRKYVDTIQASVDASLLIVNDILDLAKLDSNMVEYVEVDFMLSELVNGVRHMLEFRAEQKGVKFILEIDESIPPIVKGDSKHLNQVLINLTTNAVKFTDLGSVTLKVDKLSEENNKVKVRFSVIDTGKGIRKSSLDTIFNQYQQETRHTIRHTGGTGLGLAITKKLVDLMGGEIHVDSKYLEGTTFWVDLELEKVNGVVKTARDHDESVFQGLAGMKILMVDDNLINREILHDLLKDANSQVEIVMAEDGEDAIAKLRENPIDVILMDLQMPRKNGYEAAEFIRKKMKYPLSETPIIAMTAHALENVAESCFKAGMNDYIAKPIDIVFLVKKILVLNEKRARLSSQLNRFKTIDLEHLQELTKDNKDRILKYINIFLSNLPDELEVLKGHAEKNDYLAIRESLHKIKGIVAYMGIKSLTRLFNSPEYTNLEKLSPEKFKAFFTEIDETCHKAMEELKIVQKEL